MQSRWFCERHVVIGRPLDGRTGVMDATRGREAGEKLFRWTFAGRFKFCNEALHIFEHV